MHNTTGDPLEEHQVWANQKCNDEYQYKQETFYLTPVAKNLATRWANKEIQIVVFLWAGHNIIHTADFKLGEDNLISINEKFVQNLLIASKLRGAETNMVQQQPRREDVSK